MKKLHADYRNRSLRLEPLERRMLLTATELPNDVDTSLLLHLNGDSAGASGEIPTAQLGLTYPSGLINQAVHIDDPGTLRYATAGNIVGPEGTVEFWIKPDWNGNTNTNYAFFEVGDNFNNGMLLAIDGANNLRFIHWGDDPNTPAVENNVERGIGTAGGGLIAGNWYHLAATWRGATGEMAFYLNGQPVGSINNGVQIANFSTSYLAIGSEVGGQSPTLATFDEFRISSRARSAAEILDDYNSGLGILPVPQDQAAFALNNSVTVEWQPIGTSGQFDHYAVYRSLSPFTSVVGMTPLAQIPNVNASTYLDSTAQNGTSYYYAVTAVLSGGGESQDVPSIGPRTPRDELDLQVVSISRSPEFPRYAPNYADHTVTEPSGFGPYSFSSSSGLGGGQTFADPRFPSVGQQVTYTATVRNRGTDPYQGSLPITWQVDGNIVSTATPAVDLAPGATATFEYIATWDDLSHSLVFSMDADDARSANNTLASDPFAAPFLTYIDRTFVERFREEFTPNPATQDDDIIDWLNEHMTRFNELFVESGSSQRVHYGVLQVLDDGQSLPAIDTSPYAIFPLRYFATDGNPRSSGYYHADDDIDYGLLHEMGHQLGLIDIYQFDVAPASNLVSGQGYSGPNDLMRNVAPFLAPASALAADHWSREARGYFGQYLYNLPQTIRLRILGFDGQPLSGATVQAFQLEERPGVGKLITNQVKFQGTTGGDGILALPNIPINPALVPAIGTGDQLQDNPFGYVDVVGRNGVLLFKVEYNGFSDYAWLDISEPNVAYFQGQTTVATFDRQLALGGPVQTLPPSDLTELNATDWSAWAQGATAQVEDDTARKLVGDGSVKFVTDGAFDTYLRYPRTFSAQWDLTTADWLSVSFYAENDNIGFQTDSDPIIRLKDADGDSFQYEYYVGGNPYPLLNDARNTWRSYQIPLDASDTTTNGWRRTSLGTPDLSRIQSVEIHADTWGDTFTLWVDGLGFGPSSVVGRNLFYNQSGTSTRYDGNNLAINSLDDNAIATDKTAYLWEAAGAATFANVSSYTKGINGIMVDIAGPHGTISADDFIFRVGNNNSPGLWGTANAPTSISVRAGAGVSGSDRVTIIWNGAAAPVKQWLQVIVLANADTGLPQKPGYPVGHGDQFFFGSAVGNSGLGDTAINATVNATDEIGARNNPANLAANIPITNIYDYDRNAQVNAADQIASRNNATNPTTVLKYLNLTSSPAAPEADVFAGDEDIALASDEDIAGDSGVASALTATATTSSEVTVPKWILNRVDSIDLNSGAPAKLFQYLHDANTPRSRALLQKFDVVADSLGLDDELLDALLADLN